LIYACFDKCSQHFNSNVYKKIVSMYFWYFLIGIWTIYKKNCILHFQTFYPKTKIVQHINRKKLKKSKNSKCTFSCPFHVPKCCYEFSVDISTVIIIFITTKKNNKTDFAWKFPFFLKFFFSPVILLSTVHFTFALIRYNKINALIRIVFWMLVTIYRSAFKCVCRR